MMTVVYSQIMVILISQLMIYHGFRGLRQTQMAQQKESLLGKEQNIEKWKKDETSNTKASHFDVVETSEEQIQSPFLE